MNRFWFHGLAAAYIFRNKASFLLLKFVGTLSEGFGVLFMSLSKQPSVVPNSWSCCGTRDQVLKLDLR